MPVFQLSQSSLLFPPAHLAEADGLLAVGGDLSLPRLLAAYSQGVFPWYAEGLPILWYSTHPRCVLFPKKLHVPKSLSKVLRQGNFSFSINQAFEQVMRNCASTPQRREGGTWIIPEMIEAYCKLHAAGYAYSVEVWQSGQLVGGLYGVALGRVFFGESMFYTVPDASKAAIAWFVPKLDALGYEIVDCQQETAHMRRFGAELMDRADFLRLVSAAVMQPVQCQ